MSSQKVLLGKVIEGSKIGRQLGFPTINIGGKHDLPFGVYFCEVETPLGKYKGAMHFGPRFTVGNPEPILEVLLLDFSGDLYGQTVKIDVYNKIRDVKKFSDLESLKKQIEKDVNYIRKNYDKIFKK
jgi:FAD synthase